MLFILIGWLNFLRSLFLIKVLWYVTCKYFLPVCSLYFNILNSVFHKANILSFDNVHFADHLHCELFWGMGWSSVFFCCHLFLAFQHGMFFWSVCLSFHQCNTVLIIVALQYLEIGVHSVLASLLTWPFCINFCHYKKCHWYINWNYSESINQSESINPSHIESSRLWTQYFSTPMRSFIYFISVL